MKQYTTILALFQIISAEEQLPPEPKDSNLEAILSRMEAEWQSHKLMQDQMFCTQ